LITLIVVGVIVIIINGVNIPLVSNSVSNICNQIAEQNPNLSPDQIRQACDLAHSIALGAAIAGIVIAALCCVSPFSYI
jgi:hypothetical protein